MDRYEFPSIAIWIDVRSMIPLPPSPLLSADTCKFMQISPVIMWNEINKLRGGGVRVHYSRYSFHWILAEILQDSAGLFRILWGFFGFFLYHCADVSMGRLDNSRFTEDSLGFLEVSSRSYGSLRSFEMRVECVSFHPRVFSVQAWIWIDSS